MFACPARRLFIFSSLLTVLAILPGCEGDLANNTPTADMFAPTGMRIHPIFTQIEVDKNGKPTGIEAQLEFQDQFGDPTKASGQVLFELYLYRQTSPDPRGKRVGGPWVGSLATLAEQHERWNTTLRTYRFELTDPNLHTDQPYVLSAIFELTGGGRFFDRNILPGVKGESKEEDRNTFFPSIEPVNGIPAPPSPSTQP
jgi:hypothetical protein